MLIIVETIKNIPTKREVFFASGLLITAQKAVTVIKISIKISGMAEIIIGSIPSIFPSPLCAKEDRRKRITEKTKRNINVLLDIFSMKLAIILSISSYFRITLPDITRLLLTVRLR